MDSILKKIFIETPCPAFRMNEYIIRETAYGLVKRLRFFVEHIEAERQRLQLDIREMRVLDVGCGTGVNVTIPLGNAGYAITGIDSDEDSIKRAKEYAQESPNIVFHKTTLETAQFSQDFHVIICSEVLEHQKPQQNAPLEVPKTMLSQLRAFLNQDGCLLVTVPNGYSYFEAERWFESRFPKSYNLAAKLQFRLLNTFCRNELRVRHARESTPEYLRLTWPSLAPDQAHYQKFTPGRINQLLTGQGFEIVDFRNCTFLAGNILNRLVRDWDGFLLWNAGIADILPHWLCFDWMIAVHCAE